MVGNVRKSGGSLLTEPRFGKGWHSDTGALSCDQADAAQLPVLADVAARCDLDPRHVQENRDQVDQNHGAERQGQRLDLAPIGQLVQPQPRPRPKPAVCPGMGQEPESDGAAPIAA